MDNELTGIQPISSEIKPFQNRPTIFLNDEPVYPVQYSLTDTPGGRWSFEEIPSHNIKLFCEAGFRLFQVDLFLEHVWKESGEMDLALARKQIAGVTAACPGAAVFIRYHVNAPHWWRDAHPEEMVSYADTDYEDPQPYGLLRIIEDDPRPHRRVSLASETWFAESMRRTDQFLTELSTTEEGNSVAAIQIAHGVYGEWHNWGFFNNEPDTSEPMRQHFANWLKRAYKDDPGLQAAWSDSSAQIESVSVPGMTERAATEGIFRHPVRERATIDYYTAAHELVVDRIIAYGDRVKSSWPRPIITGAFYGYFFSVFGRQAAGGHLDVSRLLRSDKIDYLCGPQAYYPEAVGIGDPYRSRSLIMSVRLHGKLWLDEMDVEPTIPDYRYPVPLNVQKSVASVARNMMFTFSKGMGLWFYDFGPGGVDLDGYHIKNRGTQGWWDHPDLQARIREVRDLVQKEWNTPYESEADVLFVYDTESILHTASLRGTDPVTERSINWMTLNAFKAGVVFDPVHIDDLDLVDLTPYRVVVFGNTFLLDDNERRLIREKVARDGRHLIWVYAPGYTDGKRLDVQQMSDVTGINLVRREMPGKVDFVFDPPDEAAFRFSFADSAFSPRFYVDDVETVGYGRYASSGEEAFSRKLLPQHTAWYMAVPPEQPEPFVYILREAGAHVYGSNGVFYAGGGLLTYHTAIGGPQTVTLKSGKTVTIDLPDGPATVILDSSTGEILSR